MNSNFETLGYKLVADFSELDKKFQEAQRKLTNLRRDAERGIKLRVDTTAVTGGGRNSMSGFAPSAVSGSSVNTSGYSPNVGIGPAGGMAAGNIFAGALAGAAGGQAANVSGFVAQGQYCQSCGRVVRPGQTFCSSCGSRMNMNWLRRPNLLGDVGAGIADVAKYAGGTAMDALGVVSGGVRAGLVGAGMGIRGAYRMFRPRPIPKTMDDLYAAQAATGVGVQELRNDIAFYGGALTSRPVRRPRPGGGGSGSVDPFKSALDRLYEGRNADFALGGQRYVYRSDSGTAQPYPLKSMADVGDLDLVGAAAMGASVGGKGYSSPGIARRTTAQTASAVESATVALTSAATAQATKAISEVVRARPGARIFSQTSAAVGNLMAALQPAGTISGSSVRNFGGVYGNMFSTSPFDFPVRGMRMGDSLESNIMSKIGANEGVQAMTLAQGGFRRPDRPGTFFVGGIGGGSGAGGGGGGGGGGGSGGGGGGFWSRFSNRYFENPSQRFLTRVLGAVGIAQTVSGAMQAGNAANMQIATNVSGNPFVNIQARMGMADNIANSIPIAGPLGVAFNESFTGSRAALARMQALYQSQQQDTGMMMAGGHSNMINMAMATPGIYMPANFTARRRQMEAEYKVALDNALDPYRQQRADAESAITGFETQHADAFGGPAYRNGVRVGNFDNLSPGELKAREQTPEYQDYFRAVGRIATIKAAMARRTSSQDALYQTQKQAMDYQELIYNSQFNVSVEGIENQTEGQLLYNRHKPQSGRAREMALDAMTQVRNYVPSGDDRKDRRMKSAILNQALAGEGGILADNDYRKGSYINLPALVNPGAMRNPYAESYGDIKGEVADDIRRIRELLDRLGQ